MSSDGQTSVVRAIKEAARGRWPSILTALGGIPAEALDGKHHPCFRCGGTDRFRMIDAEAGALYCNGCFSRDNGDGISALQWATGKPFKEVVAMLADYLRVNGNGHVKSNNGGTSTRQGSKNLAAKIKPILPVSWPLLLGTYCQAKPPITPDGVRKCGGTVVTWGHHRCIRLEGHAPIDAPAPTAIVLCRIEGQPFPAIGKLGERKTHTIGKSVNSWLVCGDVATAETIIDVEGITDWLAVASVGLPPGWAAVTNTAGAKARGKLPRPWAKGKRVIAAGDADTPGVDGQHGAAVAYHQAGAAEVSLAQLPYPVEKDHGKDLRDWLNEGHALADLPTVVVTAEQLAEWGKKKRSADERPRICAQDQDLEKITAAAWQAVQQSNNPDRLFRYGGNPCRIERDDEGNPVTRTLDHDRMRYELARCIEWYKNVGDGDDSTEIPAYPPKDVVRDVLSEPNIPLPVLTRIVEAPVFAPDGSIQTAPGYHPAGRTFYAPAAGFTVPDVPDRPTPRDIKTASGSGLTSGV
jgi:phage/plasmid primase-like uncharacterized protein